MKILPALFVVSFSSISCLLDPSQKWFDIGTDSVYFISDIPDTWDAASSYCKSIGINGRLASVESVVIMKRLQEHIEATSRVLRIWIGIRKNSAGKFVRTGNVSLQSSFFNWGVGEPNNYKNVEECVDLTVWSMKWNDFPCDERKIFLCESDKGPNFPAIPSVSKTTARKSELITTVSSLSGHSLSLPDPSQKWFDIGTDSLYFISVTHDTWDGASSYCKSTGINGRLASVESVVIMKRLKEHIEATRNVLRLWIGIRKNSAGKFVRTGNVSLQSSFFNWDVGEPNDYKNVEDCVEVTVFSMKWNDAPCDEVMVFLCESDKEPSFPTIPSTSKTTSTKPGLTTTASFMSAHSHSLIEPSFPTFPSTSKATSMKPGLTTTTSFMSAHSLGLTDIAKECHATVIAISFLTVSLFAVFLVYLVLKRWPWTPNHYCEFTWTSAT